MKRVFVAFLFVAVFIVSFGVTSLATDNMEKMPPLDYLHTNGVDVMTIQAHVKLTDILDYNGTVRNMHIAKWVASDPELLQYPAYCVNPGVAGTAQHVNNKYSVLPKPALTYDDHVILGIFRAGYPYKTPAQLGVQDITDAYYATHSSSTTPIAPPNAGGKPTSSTAPQTRSMGNTGGSVPAQPKTPYNAPKNSAPNRQNQSGENPKGSIPPRSKPSQPLTIQHKQNQRPTPGGVKNATNAGGAGKAAKNSHHRAANNNRQIGLVSPPQNIKKGGEKK